MKEHQILVDNLDEQRYQIDVEGDAAYIEYIRQPGYVIITHTFVPPRHEGKGIAAALTKLLFEELHRKQLKLVPQCSYTAQYICRHPEWEDLVRVEN